MTFTYSNIGSTRSSDTRIQRSDATSRAVTLVILHLSDPWELTDAKIDAGDAEAKAADRSRFKPWAEVRDALRNPRS